MRRQLAVTGLAAALALGGAAALAVLKFRTAVESAARARMEVPLAAVRDALQATLALGLPLASASAVPELLARERASDPAIVDIRVVDLNGRWVFGTHGATPGQVAVPADAVARAPLRNAFELEQGQVEVHYALVAEVEAARRLQRPLAGWAAGAWLASLALAALSLVLLQRRRARGDPLPQPD